jgi:hypothetical protein
MFEWSIETEDRGTVRLMGFEPSGYPCETWLNGELLERSEEGSWSWATEAGVPSAIYQVVRVIGEYAHDPDLLSYMLNLEARHLWEKFTNDTGQSDAFRARTAAYTQYIRAKHLEHCDRPMKRFELYG